MAGNAVIATSTAGRARTNMIWSSEYRLASKPPKKITRRCSQPKSETAVREQANDSSLGLLVDPALWPVDATSVMLKNIPNRYTQEDLLDELGKRGFDETFDYFHLVMDMKSKRNKGFAFVNMRKPLWARLIHEAFHNVQLTHYNSKKIVEVALAEIQGFDANVIGYLNAHGDRVHNVWFRPIIFRQHPWKAVPLTEENLPKKLARIYHKYTSKGLGQDSAGQSSANVEKIDEESNPGSDEEEEYEEEGGPLQDGEYDEIQAQVRQFLQHTCGDATSSSDIMEETRPASSQQAILSILEKPRRKRKSRKEVKHECSSTSTTQHPKKVYLSTSVDYQKNICCQSTATPLSTSPQPSIQQSDSGNGNCFQTKWSLDITPTVYLDDALQAPWSPEAAPTIDYGYPMPCLLSSSPFYAKPSFTALMPQSCGFPARVPDVNSFTEAFLAFGSPIVTSTEEDTLLTNAWHAGFRPPPGLSP